MKEEEKMKEEEEKVSCLIETCNFLFFSMLDINPISAGIFWGKNFKFCLIISIRDYKILYSQFKIGMNIYYI